jgi:hypothetical protein
VAWPPSRKNFDLQLVHDHTRHRPLGGGDLKRHRSIEPSRVSTVIAFPLALTIRNLASVTGNTAFRYDTGPSHIAKAL